MSAGDVSALARGRGRGGALPGEAGGVGCDAPLREPGSQLCLRVCPVKKPWCDFVTFKMVGLNFIYFF